MKINEIYRNWPPILACLGGEWRIGLDGARGRFSCPKCDHVVGKAHPLARASNTDGNGLGHIAGGVHRVTNKI